jgi:hypothetical protein
MHRIKVYRPTEINPQQFSKDYNSAYWYCNPDTTELIENRDFYNAPQDSYQLAHSTSAMAINATYPKPIRDNSTPAYTFKIGDDLLKCDPLGASLVEEIVFYSDEQNNLNLLTVKRIILGSEYTIKFHNSVKDEIRGVVGFQESDNNPNHCALGYEIVTDGISLNLNPHRFDNLELDSTVLNNLKTNIIRHYFITKLTVEYQENYFASENLVNVLLTVADSYCGINKGTVEGFKDWFVQGNSDFEKWLTASINEIHKLSEKKQEQVRQLASNDNNYLDLFINIYQNVHDLGLAYQQYLRDNFQYSMTQALKQVAQEVAGVEALNYVTAWTELKADFQDRASDKIWLYEIGMGGIGVIKATHDLLRDKPDQFWQKVAEKMTRCTTAQEEGFLRYLLAQPETWLNQCATWVKAIIDARKSSERTVKIDNLLREVRRQLSIPVRQAQLKSLLRVFIPDYSQEVDNLPLVNWRIYREINYQFLPQCVADLNREPSFTEARSMLYRKVVKDNSIYPELTRLLKLYQEEYDKELKRS